METIALLYRTPADQAVVSTPPNTCGEGTVLYDGTFLRTGGLKEQPPMDVTARREGNLLVIDRSWREKSFGIKEILQLDPCALDEYDRTLTRLRKAYHEESEEGRNLATLRRSIKEEEEERRRFYEGTFPPVSSVSFGELGHLKEELPFVEAQYFLHRPRLEQILGW